MVYMVYILKRRVKHIVEYSRFEVTQEEDEDSAVWFMYRVESVLSFKARENATAVGLQPTW